MNYSSMKDALIKIVGVGGAGGNTINRIYNHPFKNVDLIAANTDNQALQKNKATYKLQLGAKLTKGLGAGGMPHIGKQAALESIEEIKDILKGANMVIIAAGMGGGTGSGAAPVIAEVSKQIGVNLTIAIVTKPFSTEGKQRLKTAEESINEIKKYVDAIIVIPNDRLLSLPPDTSAESAYQQADNILIEIITGISDLITTPADINVDFADIEAIIKNSGTALVGIGKGKGPTRHMEGIRNALNFPLIENADIKNAKGFIVYFRIPKNFAIREINEALDYLSKRASKEEAKIKYGQYIDSTLKDDEVIITVVAAGFGYEDDSTENIPIKKTEIIKTDSTLQKIKNDIEKNVLSTKPAFMRRNSSILD
ncbi:MAG: cell division protein FtsZ [Elusimicrobiales bacterium]|nr:cell division protein FtsZ [Elusimicrobiales bacterium]